MKKTVIAAALATLVAAFAPALPATAQTSLPTLDVKVAGEDSFAGGYLPGQPIPVDIAVACNGPCNSAVAEWFIWVESNGDIPATVKHYDGATGRWLPGPLAPAFRRPLLDRALAPLPGRLTLPAGTWNLRFAADLTLDGVRTPAGTYYEDYGQGYGLQVRVDPGFYEDFDTGTAYNWVPDTRGSWTFVNGHYRLTATEPMRVFSSRYNKAFQGFSFRADARVIGGGPDVLSRGFGLLFKAGASYRDGYVFHINGNGSFFIFKRVAGRTYLMTRGWVPSSAIKRGKGWWNRLEVISETYYYPPSPGGLPRLRFLINGREVKVLYDATFLGGRAGLKAFGDNANRDVFEFDNTVLRAELID